MQSSWPGNSCVTTQNQTSIIFLRSMYIRSDVHAFRSTAVHIRIHLHQCDFGCRVFIKSMTFIQQISNDS